ncbi:MAG: hypothetical protein ACWA41_12745 [Putridiphycobacter sp.]
MSHYKNNYHPLIILLYHSNMLSIEELNKIPRTTKRNWNKFNNTDYYLEKTFNRKSQF